MQVADPKRRVKFLLFPALGAALFCIAVPAQSYALECKSSAVTANSKGSFKTKAEAMESAKLAWVDKVWKAYGPYWHNLGISQNQTPSCRETRGGWACSFSAVPCRSHS